MVARQDIWFRSTFAHQGVWMRDAMNCYEYVPCYVGDLLVAMKYSELFFQDLQSKPYDDKL